MSAMSEQTETEAPDRRAVLRYNGDVSVALVGSVNPVPSIVEPGQLVSVDGWAAPVLARDDDRFAVLTGEQAAALLREAEEPASGTADERRDRLADVEARRLADEAAAAAAADDADAEEAER